MTAVTPMHTPSPLRARDYDAPQLALIRRTVAADTTPDEFNMFIEIAKRAGLDPFRRQLYCIVYSKDDPKKRKVTFITGIDGFRAVAARNRDYRPDDAEPQFEVSDARKSPSNPTGLVKAVVKAFKLAPDNQWFPVVGVAYWSEFAVMKDNLEGGFRWEDTGEKWPDTGKPKRRKVPLVDGEEAVPMPSGKWADMPFVMLAKCAESQALRKGWPEDLSGIYSPEEMERPMLDVTATDAVEQHETQLRLARVGAKDTVPILWESGQPIEAVPVGEMVDRVAKHLSAVESITGTEIWRDANRIGLQQLWGYSKSDGLEVKRMIEARLEELAKE